MNRSLATCSSALLLCILGNAAADAPAPDAAAYQTCAACHLADGNGIAGAFPPLRNRLAPIAALDGGRRYLIAVVAFGLMGPIDVDGTTYNGIMPGNRGALSAGTIAAALNHAAIALDDGDSGDFEPFTAAEVDAVLDDMDGAGPGAALELRNALPVADDDS